MGNIDEIRAFVIPSEVEESLTVERLHTSCEVLRSAQDDPVDNFPGIV